MEVFFEAISILFASWAKPRSVLKKKRTVIFSWSLSLDLTLQTVQKSSSRIAIFACAAAPVKVCVSKQFYCSCIPIVSPFISQIARFLSIYEEMAKDYQIFLSKSDFVDNEGKQ